MKVAILISGSGSNMVRLVESMDAGHPARPVLVVSNRPEAAGLTKAAALGVPTATVDHTAFADREGFEAALDDALAVARPDLICHAGFMRILTPAFVGRWAGRMLNIHPSLLPKFRGLHTHVRAIEAGETEHGATVHEVTAELDGGPILGQARLRIHPGETPQALAARVQILEHRLYPAVLARVAAGDRSRVDLDDHLVD